jgi:outer membrane lipoprotein SlyB
MKKIMLAALAAAATISAVGPQAAIARPDDRRDEYRRDRDRDRDSDRRGDYRRNYEDCKRSNGTTGLIAGGAGGAVLGNVLGGGTVGTVAGGVGGALLGQHLDKKHDQAQNRKNGC